MGNPARTFRMIPDAMIADRGLSPGSKMLYVILRMMAKGSSRLVGVSTAEITAVTGEDRRTFSRQFGELERVGWVIMEKKKSRYFEVEFVEDWPYELGHQSPSSERNNRDNNVPVKEAHRDNFVRAQGQNCPPTRTPVSQCAPAPYKEARAELNSEREERQEGEGSRRPKVTENTSNQSAPKTEPNPGVPTTIRELVAGMDAFTDDPKQLVRLRKKAPVWFARLAASKKLRGLADDDLIDWIHEALSESMDAKDIVKYASVVLKDWMTAGVRPRKVQPTANGVISTPDEELALFKTMYNGKHST